MTPEEKKEWIENHKGELVKMFNLNANSELWSYGIEVYSTYEDAVDDNVPMGSPGLQMMH